MEKEEKKVTSENIKQKPKGFDFNQLLGLVAFGALIFMAVSMFIANVVDEGSLEIIKTIGEIVMYVALAFVSFLFCASRNNPLWFGLWGAVVVVLVLAYVL